MVRLATASSSGRTPSPGTSFSLIDQILSRKRLQPLMEEVFHGAAYDETKCVEQTIEIAVQVNGKVKARIKVPAAIENADAIATAKAEPAVAEAIAGKTIAKEINVKGKLVNIAVMWGANGFSSCSSSSYSALVAPP